MRLSALIPLLCGVSLVCAAAVAQERGTGGLSDRATQARRVAPKVFIISLFPPEAEIWYLNSNTSGSFGDLYAMNITVPGFSPIFPHAHCVADGSVCQLTAGESEINSAATITALVLSSLFDLRKTYFMVAGIAGVNPRYGTLADVAFAKFAVQVALQYEFDAREILNTSNTGYIPLGSHDPAEYPSSIYGTEVFELNEALRDIAVQFAGKANLSDSKTAVTYRASYYSPATAARKAFGEEYKSAIRAPSVIACDVVTSDVYFSGTMLGEAFENTTKLYTNGTGTYCMTAQEDNAILEALLRGAMSKTVDFARVMVMRTGSDFDRPYPGLDCYDNLFYVPQGGFIPALENIFSAGNQVVMGILNGWKKTFEAGIPAKNYIGDIFGSLGGKPDFGPGVSTDGNPVQQKRGLGAPWKRNDGNLTVWNSTDSSTYQKTVVGNPIGKGKYGAEIARNANGATADKPALVDPPTASA